MRISAELLIAFVVVFGYNEVARWKRPEFVDVLTSVQKVRRLIGIGVLLILGIMLYGGTLFPPPILVPPVIRSIELLYWLSFTLLTVFIPLIAFFEFKDSIRRGSQLRREVFKSIVTSPLKKLPKSEDPPEQGKP